MAKDPRIDLPLPLLGEWTLSWLAEQPRALLAMLLFKATNSVFVLQGDANIVQAIQQAVLAECIHLKLQNLIPWGNHPLMLQIHVELIAFVGVHFRK